MSDIKQLYNTIDLSVTNSETKTSAEIKMTADSITSSVNNQVGGLQSQITQQADEISSKVSRTEVNSVVSTAITQSSDAIVYAFNHKDGSSQSVQFTGDGFDFYYNGSKLGHLGVSSNPETGTYDMCFQPTSGHGTYFSNSGSYAQVVMGALKANELHANGLIATNGTVDCSGLTINGINGWNGSIGPLTKSDGGTVTINFNGGVMTGWN
jgi:hypothetical protein